MKVMLKAADRPLFEFNTPLASIGPYESREVNATVKTSLKPYELPDWQMVRGNFELTSQP